MDNLSKTQLTIGGAGYGLAILLEIFADNRYWPSPLPFIFAIITTLLLLIVLITEVFRNAGRKLLRRQKNLPDDTKSTLSASIITIIMIVVAWFILFTLLTIL